ncbi:MAG: right-handed parallel beta-helix repeat-containing protein [Candidatus Bathyarchaeota archaeon]|nr:right-handed parallel beta-helix repeat-containing protein [Candidatus Bathyarchaeota archaeon]
MNEPTLEVMPNPCIPGQPIVISGSNFPAGAIVNLTCYSHPIGNQLLAESVYVDGLGHFSYNTFAPDLKQVLGSGLLDESALSIIFGASDSTGGWHTIVCNQYKRGLIQFGPQVAPNGQLFGNFTVFSSSATSLIIGQSVSIAGTLFYPGNMVFLLDDETPVGSTVVNQTGFFNTSIIVPATNSGSHILIIRDANDVRFHVPFYVDGGSIKYSLIQDLINAADIGDTINVPSGHYYGNLFVNKTVKLVGVSSSSTILDGNSVGNVVTITANNVQLSGFTIQNSGDKLVLGKETGVGIYVESCNLTTISDNVIRNNHEGVLFKNCVHGTLYENQILNTFGDCGVRIRSCPFFTFTRNVVSDCAITGVAFWGCSNSIILENQITNSEQAGLVVSNCFGVTVSRNEINNIMFMGINLVGASHNTLFGNTIIGTKYGIFFTSSSDNNFTVNSLHNNNYALCFSDSANNHIYHNNFIGNSFSTFFSHGNNTNFWDDGYPSGGNFWSAYNGIDVDSDGIGDSAYVINDLNQDQYPLIDSTDIDPPVTTIVVNGTMIDSYWFNSTVEVLLFASDYLSVVAKTEYSYDTRVWIEYDAPFSLSNQEGITVVYYRSVDSKGNVETIKNQKLGIDTMPPTIGDSSHIPDGVVKPDQSVKVTVMVTDAASGVQNVTLTYFVSADEKKIPMMYNSADQTYDCIIPGQQETTVEYTISAYDNTGHYAVDNNAGQYIVSSVIPEFSSKDVFSVFLLISVVVTLFVIKYTTISAPTKKGVKKATR